MARAAKAKKEKRLEDALWDCRVALRGVGSIEKNRDAVISLVFLKFAGDKFEKRRQEILEEYGDVPAFLEKASFYNAKNVFYLDKEARWSFIVENASANDIAVKIDAAMASIEEKNPSLKGTLPLNLFATLGVSGSSLKTLIDSVNNISKTRYQEEDLIGRVYEYFLQIFAVGSSKEDGEFYTPACIVQLIAELIEPYEGVVYDPCCGSGGMFVQSHKFVERHHGNKTKISIVGQESNPDTWRLCKMNLAIRGIAHNLGEKNASSFTEDQHKGRKVDFIMANPPFNLKGWRGEDELTKDARWSGYGVVPPVANANYAWILHMLSKLDVNHGVAGFLLANGALNSDEASEYAIRKKLIEDDRIEAIIVLPRDMFYTTDISVTLWILNMNKGAHEANGRKLRDRKHEILFVDLRTWDQNIETYTYDKGKRKKKVVLTANQIDEVKHLYNTWQSGEGYQEIPELCASVSLSGENGLRSKNFSLAPSDYIQFVNHDTDIDFRHEMPAITQTVSALLDDEMRLERVITNSLNQISQLDERDSGTDETISIRIGDLIELVDERNELGIREFYGLNIEKEFMPTAATTDGLDERNYKIVRSNRFVFSGMQTGRDRCIRIGMYTGDDPIIVSPAYMTFEVKRDAPVLPLYLYMLFISDEKDRYGWFRSDSSIRANLDWDVFCDFVVELPPLQIQKIYSELYFALRKMQETTKNLRRNMKVMCPVLIQDSLHRQSE